MRIIFTLYLFASITFLSFSQPTDGLVAYYPFNGNANDESGNEHHGTTNGGVSWTQDRFGNSFSAAQFDGLDSYIKTDTDNENIDHIVGQLGVYYIHVYLSNGISNTYTIWWDDI